MQYSTSAGRFLLSGNFRVTFPELGHVGGQNFFVAPHHGARPGLPSARRSAHDCSAVSLASMVRATLKAARAMVPLSYSSKQQSTFYDPCSCQTSHALFDAANMRESGISSTSRTIVRQRALGLAVIKVVEHAGNLAHQKCLQSLQPPPGFSVYNTEAHGQMHEIFASKFASYTASEYVSPTAKPGSVHMTAVGLVRHEDLRNLSFPNNSFDLVLSAEVFEHIPDPYLALSEVFRVLKPGGAYLWTVPMNPDIHSRDAQLSLLSKDGKRFDAAEPVSTVPDGPKIKAPQFHGDPLSPQGIVVFQIFGAGELLPKMCKLGFNSTRTWNIYSPEYGIVAPGGVTVMMATKT